MGRLWRHVLSVASKRAGRPPLRLQAFPIAGRLEVTAGSDSQPPYKTKCLFAFRLAVVSNQRWFCGPRCVDGLTRGFPPELEHGPTLKTRAFRGSKASWKTASQAGSGPHSVGSKDYRRERQSTPYKTKCLFAFRLAVVSDQRWFCGPRCVDGLTRGLSPELEHGTTLKTRDFRGFKASWKTASQAGSGPHSVGSKGPPPGAQTNDQPKRANKKRLAARDEVVFVVPPKFSRPRSRNGKRNLPSNNVTCRERHRLLQVQPWSFGNDTGQKERALAFHHR